MDIHMGSIIKLEVVRKHLTHKEFGALIHTIEKDVFTLYDCISIPIDLLLEISRVLQTDFLGFYYAEEPLKSIRNDQISQLNHQIKMLTKQIEICAEEIVVLKKELATRKEMHEIVKDYLSLTMKEHERYKQKLSDVSRS